MTGAEEVIQHVYQKYGRDRAAMVANVVRYRSRSALRDVGKALGLSETALDRVAKFLSSYENVRPEVLAQMGIDPSTGLHEHCFSCLTKFSTSRAICRSIPAVFYSAMNRCMTWCRLKMPRCRNAR
jgi:hypothetical protein